VIINASSKTTHSTLEEQERPILFLASEDASYIIDTVPEVSGDDRG